MKLQNKTALVTGAARGIGQAIAIELAQNGCNIIGVDLDEKDLQSTAQQVQSLGKQFLAWPCDLCNADAVAEMVTTIFEQHEGYQILVNNAGIAPTGPFDETDFSVWQKTVEVNLLALMRLTYLTLPYFQKSNQGHIVNISSVAGKIGTEGLVAYSASKHGVVGFSSALLMELMDTNIGVSWVCPVYTRTRMIEGIQFNEFLTPVIQPQDVAKIVRKAIRYNMTEVFAPRKLFFLRIASGLFPNFLRFLFKRTKAARGYYATKKQLEENIK